jgi:hypothetical protein
LNRLACSALAPRCADLGQTDFRTSGQTQQPSGFGLCSTGLRDWQYQQFYQLGKTVAAALRADAWATALLILGEQAGPALAQTLGLGLGLHALFVRREDDGWREILLIDGQLQA